MTQADRIQARLFELAACSDEPDAITRLFLSPAHARAIELVRTWMDQAGLVTSLDANATLIGHKPGPHSDSPLLLLGSHIDTVRNAGRYDGCLGVLAAIEAATTDLPYALQIRAFGDEEGVRFPVTLTGAHATAGRFDPAWLDAADADGITMRQALAAFPTTDDPPTEAFAYLELHIEQGPVLEQHNAPLGIVTAINGASRFLVTVRGRAGHAGTVPMNARRDALTATAAMILAVRDAARDYPGAVATVGRIEVRPNAINVIPGETVFTIDLRAPDDMLRAETHRAIETALIALAEQERVELTLTRTHDAQAVACDPRLQRHLAAAIAKAGLPTIHLPSGAGHDAMAVAPLCPIGMLFVRCAGGISHHPDESVRTEDIAAALRVLTKTLQSLDPQDFAR